MANQEARVVPDSAKFIERPSKVAVGRLRIAFDRKSCFLIMFVHVAS